MRDEPLPVEIIKIILTVTEINSGGAGYIGKAAFFCHLQDAPNQFSSCSGYRLRVFFRQYNFGIGGYITDNLKSIAGPDHDHTVNAGMFTKTKYHFNWGTAQEAAGRLQLLVKDTAACKNKNFRT